jgi:hypothetical protein
MSIAKGFPFFPVTCMSIAKGLPVTGKNLFGQGHISLGCQYQKEVQSFRWNLLTYFFCSQVDF